MTRNISIRLPAGLSTWAKERIVSIISHWAFVANWTTATEAERNERIGDETVPWASWIGRA